MYHNYYSYPTVPLRTCKVKPKESEHSNTNILRTAGVNLNITTSTSDLQSSTAIADQSLGKLVSTYLNHNDATMYL